MKKDEEDKKDEQESALIIVDTKSSTYDKLYVNIIWRFYVQCILLFDILMCSIDIIQY